VLWRSAPIRYDPYVFSASLCPALSSRPRRRCSMTWGLARVRRQDATGLVPVGRGLRAGRWSPDMSVSLAQALGIAMPGTGPLSRNHLGIVRAIENTCRCGIPNETVRTSQTRPSDLPNQGLRGPLTRLRSLEPGDVPTAMMAEYYGQRASAGLIISEATQISFQAKGYSGSPGIHTAEQIAGWRQVNDAIHQRGGHSAVQVWHTGRISTPRCSRVVRRWRHRRCQPCAYHAA
jgi:hypothetical protein